MSNITAFPSAANFVLLRVPDAEKVHAGLRGRGVLVRSLHGAHTLLDQCLRFTVGTRHENDLLLDAFGKTLATLG